MTTRSLDLTDRAISAVHRVYHAQPKCEDGALEWLDWSRQFLRAPRAPEQERLLRESFAHRHAGALVAGLEMARSLVGAAVPVPFDRALLRARARHLATSLADLARLEPLGCVSTLEAFAGQEAELRDVLRELAGPKEHDALCEKDGTDDGSCGCTERWAALDRRTA